MLTWVLAATQVGLAARVVARLAATSRGIAIAPAAHDGEAGSLSIIVPVLDEERRLEPCLDALRKQGACVREIVVVDGGSRDATQAIVRRAAALDARVRLVEASAAPAGWNGKAWNLHTGLLSSDSRSRAVVMLDADVRPSPALCRALVAHASAHGLAAFSVAARQRLAGPIDALLHPALLATLVYRFGIPGTSSTSFATVQANGQCFYVDRSLLLGTDAIAAARDSHCEDVTIARTLARAGTAVGFYEAPGLVATEMYDDWRDMLRNWPRSLPMKDRYTHMTAWLGLLEVLLVAALPPWIAAGSALRARPDAATLALRRLQYGLVAMRLGVLAGMRRAYEAPGPGYWLSPAADLPACLAIMASMLRRRHVWRGRTLV